jgi:hypothetical protein
MFQLYKNRNFSDLISDTFSFLKIYGKHYFKNYFIINGSLLLVLMVLFYVIFKVYFDVLFSNMNNQDPSFLMNYFNDNSGIVIGVFCLLGLLFIFMAMLNFAFPTIYFYLYEKNNGTNFTAKDCLNTIKGKMGKIAIFFLALLLLTFTVGVLIFGLVFALFFIFIGIPLLIIIGPAIINVVNLSFYIYMNSEIGVFQAFSKGIEYLRQKFWPAIGSSLIIYIIIQVASYIFTMIPYSFAIFSLFSSENKNVEDFSFFGIIMVIVMCIAFVGTMVLNNLIFINSGLIYYSIKEDNENIYSRSTIDQIGQHEE